MDSAAFVLYALSHNRAILEEALEYDADRVRFRPREGGRVVDTPIDQVLDQLARWGALVETPSNLVVACPKCSASGLRLVPRCVRCGRTDTVQFVRPGVPDETAFSCSRCDARSGTPPARGIWFHFQCTSCGAEFDLPNVLPRHWYAFPGSGAEGSLPPEIGEMLQTLDRAREILEANGFRVTSPAQRAGASGSPLTLDLLAESPSRSLGFGFCVGKPGVGRGEVLAHATVARELSGIEFTLVGIPRFTKESHELARQLSLPLLELPRPAEFVLYLRQGFPEQAAHGLVGSGVPGLDRRLGGGLVPGRAYLLAGPPGSGRTTIGIQFLLEGARRSEPGILVLTDQGAEVVIAAARGLKLPVEEEIRLGRIQIIEGTTQIWEKKAKGLKDPYRYKEFVQQILSDILKQVQLRSARRLVIDTVTPLLPERSRDEARELVGALERLGTTTLLLEVDSGELVPLVEESFVSGVIRLRVTEEEGQLRRHLLVTKMSGRSHDLTVARYEIGTGVGIHL